MDCDRVVVMEAGRMAEVGTPAELRRRVGGLFARMVDQEGLAEGQGGVLADQEGLAADQRS